MKRHHAPQFDLPMDDFTLAGETQAAPAPAPAPTAPAPTTPDLFPGLAPTRAPRPQATKARPVQTWEVGDDELPIPAPHVPLDAPLPPACACVSSCAGRDGRPTPEDFHEGEE